MARAAVVVAVVAALLVAAAWLFQRRLIYLPSGGEVPPASSVVPGARDVPVRTADGLELRSWYVPAEPPRLDVGVLVAHGNAGNRAGRAGLAEALAEEGMSVLLLDYRGYGGNPGTPSEQGLRTDVRAARTWLVEEAGLSPDRLVYFGESVGAAFVAELAAEHPPAGLVLRSPFESLAAVAAVHYPFVPSFLLREELAVAEHVRGVQAPTVVVYGAEDSIVPPEQSQAVARAAANLHEEVRVPGADHNDPALIEGRPVVDAVVDLVTTVTAAE